MSTRESENKDTSRKMRKYVVVIVKTKQEKQASLSKFTKSIFAYHKKQGEKKSI